MKHDEILRKVNNFAILRNYTNDELNQLTNSIFRLLPFYKVLEINENEVKKTLCFLLDNYEKLDENNKKKLDLFLIDYGWISHKRDSSVKNDDIVSSILHDVLKHDDKHLTVDQFNMLHTMEEFYNQEKNNALLISAPTSFGKTTLVIDSIAEIIKLKKNIMFIFPNKNLINEMTLELKNKYGLNAYISNSVISFTENYSDAKSNIFIGTAERYFGLNQILESLHFDLVIIDEAYKVYNYVENRSKYLALTLKRFVNKSKLLLLFPGVHLDSFLNRLECLDIQLDVYNTLEFKDEIVSYTNIIVKVEEEKLSYYSLNQGKKQLIKESKTLGDSHTNYDLLIDLFNNFPYTKNKSIIYLNSPEKIYELASTLMNNEEEIELGNPITKAYLNYLDDNFPESYILIELLKHGIVLNIGPMDDLSKKFSVNCFIRDPSINLIIANATINEGVNLFAQNLIVVSNRIEGTNGDIELIQKNVMGRVGRFNQYFVGNRIVIDKAINDNAIVRRLKKSQKENEVQLDMPKTILDDNIKSTISKDISFSDKFLQDNGIENNAKVYIPLSNYVFPEKVYQIIEDYFSNVSILNLESYITSFFTYESLLLFLSKMKEKLEENGFGHILFNNNKKRNIPYLVRLYLDYLAGVSIKVMIQKNENSVLSVDKSGQFYFRYDTIYITTNDNFDYTNNDRIIDFSRMTKKEIVDFENKYIRQFLYDINNYCAFSMKRLFSVAFYILTTKFEDKKYGSDLYSKYWNMIESGTNDDKILKLLSLGIEDKYLQNMIIKDETIYFKIVNSNNVEKTVMEIFGSDSVEYYALKL